MLDFYCPELKLAIEIDGDSHFIDDNAIEYDKRRENHINQFGIVFLRFRNVEIYQNLDKVFEKIEEKVKEIVNLKGK